MRVVRAVRVEIVEKEKMLEQRDAKLTALQGGGGAHDFLQPPSVQGQNKNRASSITSHAARNNSPITIAY